MARINTYAQDPRLNGADKVLGTDATDRSTKNFSLTSLGQFLARTGLADVGQTAYPFTLQGNADPGMNVTSQGIYLPTDLLTTTAATNIFISNVAGNGKNLGIASELLATGGIIKISALNDSWEGYFDVGTFDSVLESGQTVGYNIQVTPRPNENTGSTIPTFDNTIDRYVSIAVVDAPNTGSGGGGFTQTDADARYVRYDAAQTISELQRTQARVNIGAGTGTLNASDFSISADGNTLTTPAGDFMPVTGGGTMALPINFGISGRSTYASGASQSYTYTLTNQTGFTISNLAWSVINAPSGVTIDSATGVLTDSDTSVRTGTYTVRATFDYVQTDLTTNTATGHTVDHSVRIFAPYYSGIQTTVPTAFVPNASLTRATTELVSGGTISFTSGGGDTEAQEAIINLRDADFASPTFRTGGFLIITPQETFDGGDYTTYVISLTPNTRIDIEVI